jgi:hypothetical protein
MELSREEEQTKNIRGMDIWRSNTAEEPFA